MEKYDLIIIGATFEAFGIADSFKGTKLVIEEKAKPGYEFIDSFHNGTDYDKEPETKEGKEFKEFLDEKDMLGKIYVPEWAAYLSSWICRKNTPVLLMTNVLKITEYDGGYRLTVFNTEGINEFYAKQVIDTRTKDFCGKTLGAAIYSGRFESFHEDMKITGLTDTLTVVEVDVPDDFTYAKGREKFYEIWKNRPEQYAGCLVAAVADIFFKKSPVKDRKISDNYTEVYSTYFANPLLAYDGGAKIGGGLNG